MIYKYFLDEDHNVCRTRDLLYWSVWMDDFDNRRVKQDQIGDYWVSTVFLGIDHSFGDGLPLVFETMIKKDDEWLDYQTRCVTWTGALEMHKKAVEYVHDLNKKSSNADL